eukprot:CAMPEP_0197269556 /NCGR_PEP_ID=MMETSP1432-20130617/5626_1 /TAXON_ID=44447 /ORGANISM="Pseudo-nitzschia delicatissima, Strain UNC1205" /LENGTH=66 /DNA_ID=CAMNT_0042734735 /DNA_START=34 /DNA_END=234 /DNA_ORIENTATION=+
MSPKRSQNDVFANPIKVGKPYRGFVVEKIDYETTNLSGGKVKTKRMVHMEGGGIITETHVGPIVYG